MIDTIVWDNDGTLVDTEALYFEATRQVLASVGHTLTRERYIAISLGEGRSCFTGPLGLGPDGKPIELSAARIEELRTWRNEIYTEMLHQGVALFPGVRDCLSRLAGKVRMGLVTGSRRDHYEVMHRRTGLRQFFEFEITHDEYASSKPDPEPFLVAIRRHGLDPATTIAVDDAERGIVAAHAAGLRAVAVPNELTRPGDFSTAWRVLGSVAELPALVAAG